MSRGVSKVILMGNLGKDPIIRDTTTGGKAASFSIATQEEWKDKQTGQKVQKSEWHNIVVFNKLAEICGQYLKKGSRVFIEGSIKTRKWQDKNGEDKYTTEIVANEINILDTKSNSHGNVATRNDNAPNFDDDSEIPF